ncbi:hypothetical protein AX16_007795 [Volvariella volvacea WC 439]|nr:hypothetical protein AX16_007795 [Volvariella volvacea WC 439]
MSKRSGGQPASNVTPSTIARRAQEELKVLQNYETVIILDNSPTMLNNSVSSAASTLVSRVWQYADCYSRKVDMYNAYPGNAMNVERDVHLKRPGNGRKQTLHRFLKSQLDTLDLSIPKNFIIVTDGAFDLSGWGELNRILSEVDQQYGGTLDGLKTRKIGFQFVQLGNVTNAEGHFRNLDTSQSNADTVRVNDPDNLAITDYIEILLGGIHPRVDKHGSSGVYHMRVPGRELSRR